MVARLRSDAAASHETRRKSDVVCANWRRACSGDVMPPLEAMDRVVADELSSYCVQGGFTEPNGVSTITGMGAYFTRHLDNAEAQERSSFPAAVLVGVMVSLSNQLRHSWAPVLTEGEFLTGRQEIVRYRAAVLPFHGEGRHPQHWVGLASWLVAGQGGAPLRAH